MLKILWKREKIAPEEQFLLFSTIFYNLILDSCVITRTRFFLRDKRLFEITEVEITRVDCTSTEILHAHPQQIIFLLFFMLPVFSICYNLESLSQNLELAVLNHTENLSHH